MAVAATPVRWRLVLARREAPVRSQRFATEVLTTEVHLELSLLVGALALLHRPGEVWEDRYRVGVQMPTVGDVIKQSG